jgi:hypothetical protein
MAIGITQKTIVLNDLGLAERQRTSTRNGVSKTSSRMTVSIKADPLPLVFDPKRLGQGVADVAAQVIRDKIRGLSETVTPATQAMRSRALTAFRNGAPWAKRRYGGLYIPPSASIVGLPGATGKRSNRLPPMEPGATSPSFWRDSGRFIAGMIVRPTKGNEWVVNVPANRFDPVTFNNGGREALLVQIRRLQELVPEFGDARALERHPDVRAAIGDATDNMLFQLLGRAYRRRLDLQKALRAGRYDAFRKGLAPLLTSLGV